MNRATTAMPTAVVSSASLLLLVVLVLAAESFAVIAFTASLPMRATTTTARTTSKIISNNSCDFCLLMAPLSNEEIFARMQQQNQQQQQVGLGGRLGDGSDIATPAPMLFDEEMLADMQAVLLSLETRARDGPGSLDREEVELLELRMTKIVSEMKANEHLKPARPARSESTTSATATGTFPPPPFAAAPPQQFSAPTTAANVHLGSADPGPAVIDMDTPSDEGAAYNGLGGMGQAPDTVNTYVIPGMDEMTPDEYRKALQDSVIDRQRQRKASGVTGNKATWDYLNSLTGETGVLKKDSAKPPEKNAFQYKKPTNDDGSSA
jgi:hypothetical protein